MRLAAHVPVKPTRSPSVIAEETYILEGGNRISSREYTTNDAHLNNCIRWGSGGVRLVYDCFIGSFIYKNLTQISSVQPCFRPWDKTPFTVVKMRRHNSLERRNQYLQFWWEDDCRRDVCCGASSGNCRHCNWSVGKTRRCESQGGRRRLLRGCDQVYLYVLRTQPLVYCSRSRGPRRYR